MKFLSSRNLDLFFACNLITQDDLSRATEDAGIQVKQALDITGNRLGLDAGMTYAAITLDISNDGKHDFIVESFWSQTPWAESLTPIPKSGQRYTKIVEAGRMAFAREEVIFPRVILKRGANVFGTFIVHGFGTPAAHQINPAITLPFHISLTNGFILATTVNLRWDNLSTAGLRLPSSAVNMNRQSPVTPGCENRAPRVDTTSPAAQKRSSIFDDMTFLTEAAREEFYRSLREESEESEEMSKIQDRRLAPEADCS